MGKAMSGVDMGNGLSSVRHPRMQLTKFLRRHGSTIISLVALVVSISSLVQSRPPDPIPIVRLIDEEARLAREKRVDDVVKLYMADAAIRDAGRPAEPNQPFRESIIWEGITEIRRRYEDQSRDVTYAALEHIDAVVTFDPSGHIARAVSSTEGTFSFKGGPLTRISTVGGDEWTFQYTAGGWKVKTFSYHLR